MKKRLFYATLLLLSVTVAAGTYLYRSYTRRIKPVSEMSPVFTMKAMGLFTEFAQHAAAANGKYPGKVIEVSGLVKSIDKNDTGLCTVSLGDSASLSSIRCSMDTGQDLHSAKVSVGIPVTIRGICTGYMADDMGLGADVIMNRAVLIK